MAFGLDPIDFGGTQRIVLLLDLNPLFHLSDPSQYLNVILSSAEIILSHHSLSSSLFAFKLFLSSLSPILSSSKLSHQSHLSFHHPSATLLSLFATLNSVSKTLNSAGKRCSSRGDLIASSLRQLLFDYAWECPDDDLLDNATCFGPLRSNLIILFTPLCGDLKSLSEFVDVGTEDEILRNEDLFCTRVHGIFESVKIAFVRRDIHVSWVDVKYKPESSVEEKVGESEVRFRFFQKAIKNLDWGFCSTDSIVLGSALVPFGLIYPMIGVSPIFRGCDRSGKRIHGQLSLEISDVNGKPLECKYCDINLIDVKMLPTIKFDAVFHSSETTDSQTGGKDQGSSFWERCDSGVVKIHVQSVKRYDDCQKLDGEVSDTVIVGEFLGESENDQQASPGDCFANRVLEMLMAEMGSFKLKSPPMWQILLSFLYKEGYWAFISVSDGIGHSWTGILKPFTFNLAVLSILHDFVEASCIQQRGKAENETLRLNADGNCSNAIDNSILVNGKRKKDRLRPSMYRDLTWSSFYKAAFDHTEMDLAESYFAGKCNNSKKMKFLKCWRKQVRKSCFCSLPAEGNVKPEQDRLEEIEERPSGSNHESEQPLSSSFSLGDDSLTEASRVQDESALGFCSESAEEFFSNLPNKIQDGLQSEGVDLLALAQRLVSSCIHWLLQKHEVAEHTSESLVVKSGDTLGRIISSRLVELLLRDPKDLTEKNKTKDPSFQKSEGRSTGVMPEYIIREYELQILFRMEILQSEVGASIEELLKQKFVKQICLLLENIQCHMEGGFFGDWSFDNYVRRTIKSRYADTLEGVVRKIYRKMDLMLFGDEDETSNSLLNRDDSNQSWGEVEREGKSENEGTRKSILAEKEKCVQLQPVKNDHESPQGMKRKEHNCKLLEAQKKRERARRFASFTSWMPDLQRVWAPKQMNPLKSKFDSSQKQSKRNERRKATYDMVRETPMTENKRPRSGGNNFFNNESKDCGINSSSSVSKALFQDEE